MNVKQTENQTANALTTGIPMLPVRVELVCSNASVDTIHGWQSSRLLKFAGHLYATVGVFRSDEKPGDMMGSDRRSLIFRREPDGRWVQVAAVNSRSYTWCVAADGTFWIVGPTSYHDAKTIRTRVPGDFSTFEEVYDGKGSSYLGASVSPEGNFLLLHAEINQLEAFVPNAIIGAFYDCQANRWYRSRLETPEGRYGYEGILLRGNSALAVLNSAIGDKLANPVPPHYSWRHVRLGRCDDLTKGQWENRPWLMPKYGETFLHDLIRGPDGLAYLAYTHRASARAYEEMVKTPPLHYITRIHDDLEVETFPTGIEAGFTRILVNSEKSWFVIGRSAPNQNFHLWKVDSRAGFKPVKEYALPGTDKLEGYVTHTLRPERFGGESDGDTVHLFTSKHVYQTDRTTIDHAEMWHACFDLPADR